MQQPFSSSFWRDVRFWRFAGQAIAVILLVFAFAFLLGNLNRNLQQLGIRLGFDFLRSQAGFTITDTPLPYQPSDSYAIALLVGLVNSLRVILVGIIVATIVGVTAGIARLSDNWLVRNLAMVYVETLRNTPLLLQLFFGILLCSSVCPLLQPQCAGWAACSASAKMG